MKRFILLILFLLISPVYVNADEIKVNLSECIDGDTAKFLYDNGEIVTYRFLGIDTPEISHPTKGDEPYAKEASDYVCNKLKNAEEIIVEIDEKADEFDKYGRNLAWIFVDDKLLQEELVNLGYARVTYLYDDYKYNNVIEEAERIAKTSKVGIWAEDILINREIDNNLSNIVTSYVEEEEKSFISKIFTSIINKVTSIISNFIDSILDKIEEMVS